MKLKTKISRHFTFHKENASGNDVNLLKAKCDEIDAVLYYRNSFVQNKHMNIGYIILRKQPSTARMMNRTFETSGGFIFDVLDEESGNEWFRKMTELGGFFGVIHYNKKEHPYEDIRVNLFGEIN